MIAPFHQMEISLGRVRRYAHKCFFLERKKERDCSRHHHPSHGSHVVMSFGTLLSPGCRKRLTKQTRYFPDIQRAKSAKLQTTRTRSQSFLVGSMGSLCT